MRYRKDVFGDLIAFLQHAVDKAVLEALLESTVDVAIEVAEKEGWGDQDPWEVEAELRGFGCFVTVRKEVGAVPQIVSCRLNPPEKGGLQSDDP